MNMQVWRTAIFFSDLKGTLTGQKFGSDKETEVYFEAEDKSYYDFVYTSSLFIESS